MTIKTTSAKAATRVKVTGVLGFREIPELREALLRALDKGRPIEVDARGLESGHAAYLQVLMSARLTAATRGIELHVRDDIDGTTTRLAAVAGLDGTSDLGLR